MRSTKSNKHSPNTSKDNMKESERIQRILEAYAEYCVANSTTEELNAETFIDEDEK